MRGIVGRVQLATESRAPAAFHTKRREERRGTFRNCDIQRGTQVRDLEILARESRQELGTEADRAVRARGGSFLVVQGREVVTPEPAGELPRWHPLGRGQDQKADAAMDWEDGFSILEPDERVDRRLGEQRPPKPRAALVGCETERQHEPQPAAGARQHQRALREQLILVCVAG